MTDALADILRMMRLSSSVYFHEQFSAPWGMEVGQSPYGQFHLVVSGECFLTTVESEEPVRMGAGDIVVFPTGAPHVLSDEPGRKSTNGQAVVTAILKNENPFEGKENATTLICGHFELDESIKPTFGRLLPSVMLVPRKEAPVDSWIGQVLDIVMDETRDMDGAGAVVAERLAEALFVAIMRSYTDTDGQAGLIAAMRDPTVKSAMDAMHRAPDNSWTLLTLAKEIGASRTSLAVKFKDRVGIAPMKYLTELRMTRAIQMLRSSDDGVSVIAERVGYSSEASFIRAFKRQFGKTPGRSRVGDYSGSHVAG